MLVSIRTLINRFDSKLVDDRYYLTLHYDASLFDFDLHSRSQECEKAKTSAAYISQSFQLIWMEFGVLFRLVSTIALKIKRLEENFLIQVQDVKQTLKPSESVGAL